MVKKPKLKVLSQKGTAMMLAGLMTIGAGAAVTSIPEIADSISLTASAATLNTGRIEQLTATRNGSDTSKTKTISLSSSSDMKNIFGISTTEDCGKINTITVTSGSDYVGAEKVSDTSFRIWGTKTSAKKAVVQIRTTNPVKTYNLTIDRTVPVKPSAAATDTTFWHQTNGIFTRTVDSLTQKTTIQLADEIDTSNISSSLGSNSNVTATVGSNATQLILQPKKTASKTETITVYGSSGNVYEIKVNKTSIGASAGTITVQTGKTATKTMSKAIRSVTIDNTAKRYIDISKDGKTIAVTGKRYTASTMTATIAYEDGLTQTISIKMTNPATTYIRTVEVDKVIEITDDSLKDESADIFVSTINGQDMSDYVSIHQDKNTGTMIIKANKHTLDLTTQKNITIIAKIGNTEAVKVNLTITGEVSKKANLANQSTKTITSADAPLNGYIINKISSESSNIAVKRESNTKATMTAKASNGSYFVTVTWRDNTSNERPDIKVVYYVKLTQKINDYSADSSKNKTVGVNVYKDIQPNVKDSTIPDSDKTNPNKYRAIQSVSIKKVNLTDYTNKDNDTPIATIRVNDNGHSFRIEGIKKGSAIIDIVYSTGIYRYKLVVDDSAQIKKVYDSNDNYKLTMAKGETKQLGMGKNTSGRSIKSVKVEKATSIDGKTDLTYDSPITCQVVDYTTKNSENKIVTVRNKRIKLIANTPCKAKIRITYDNNQYSYIDATVEAAKTTKQDVTMTAGSTETHNMSSTFDTINSVSSSNQSNATASFEIVETIDPKTKKTIRKPTVIINALKQSNVKITVKGEKNGVEKIHEFNVKINAVQVQTLERTATVTKGISSTIPVVIPGETVTSFTTPTFNKTYVHAQTSGINKLIITGNKVTTSPTTVKFSATTKSGKTVNLVYKITVKQAGSTSSVSRKSTIEADGRSYSLSEITTKDGKKFDYLSSISSNSNKSVANVFVDYSNKRLTVQGLKKGTTTVKLKGYIGSQATDIQYTITVVEPETKISVKLANGKKNQGVYYNTSTKEGYDTVKLASNSNSAVAKVVAGKNTSGVGVISITPVKKGTTTATLRVTKGEYAYNLVYTITVT